MPKFKTKNALFGDFGVRILKTIVIFRISTLEFSKLRNFVKKCRCVNLRPKMSHLCISGLEFLKLLSYFKSAASNCQIAKFLEKKENA